MYRKACQDAWAIGFQKESPHDANTARNVAWSEVVGLPAPQPMADGLPEGLSARRDGLPEGLSARNTFGSSHQHVFLRDPDELMKRFPWLRKSLAEGLQWQIIHPSSSACTWSIAAALARACGTQDVHEFEAMLEMLDFLDKVAPLKFGDEERDGGDR